MADELPPLAQLPSAPPSPEFVDQLEHSANWARVFGGQDTNIAQRHRHNQDIEQYAAVLQQQRAQAQAELLQTNKAAQSLWLGQQKLDLQAEEAEMRMKHATEIQPLKMEAMRNKIQADLAQERAATEMARLKEATIKQIQTDNEKFAKTMNDGTTQGVRPGTPEWVNLMTRARLESPGMDTKVFDDTWQATSRSKLTFEEHLAQDVERKKTLMALDPKDPPEAKALERDRSLYARELSKAESRRSAAKDDDTKALFDQDIREYKEKLNETESRIRTHREGGTPATAAPAAPAVAVPKAGEERSGYRFKGGNPADKANWEKI